MRTNDAAPKKGDRNNHSLFGEVAPVAFLKF